MRTTGGGSPGGDASRLRQRRYRCRRIALVSATVAMVAVPLRPAIGAVSNTTVLTGGPSGQPNDVHLIAANSAAIVYSVTDPELAARTTTYIQPHAGSARPLPAQFNAAGASAPSLVGDMLGTYVPAAATSEPGTFVYSTIDGSTSGSVPVAAGAFEGTSADGYLYTALSDTTAGAVASTHLYDVNVTSRTVTDLGALPGNPAIVLAIASPLGVLVEARTTDSSLVAPSLSYVRYANPNVFVQLASSAPIQGVPVVGTSSVAWLENSTIYSNDQSFDPAATKVVRVTFTGSVTERLAAPNAYEVAVTTKYTGLLTTSATGAAASLSTVAATGGQQAVYPTPVGADLLSTGSAFVVTQGGTPSTAGIYALTSAAGSALLQHAAGAATLRASTVTVSPARVAWRDNGVGAGLWSRALSTVQTTLAAGDPKVVSPQPDPTSEESASSSGSRIAYVQSGTTSTDTATSVWLAASGQAPRIIGPAAPDDDLTLSGTRLLQRHDDGSATLTDLISGATSNLPAPVEAWSGAFVGRTDYELWGNDLAWLASDGSVWFKDLTTGTTTEVSDAVAAGSETVLGSVSVAAGIVAWSEIICAAPQGSDAPGGTCHGAGLKYRDALAIGQIYTVPSVQPTRIQLSSGYLAFDDGSDGTPWVDVTPLHSAVVQRIAPLSSGGTGQAEFSISGSLLGWIGADNLPHAAALPHVGAKPQYLGNGSAPSSLVTDGAHSWDADFVTSEGLTKCAVTISSGATTIRVLPCDPTQMMVGEVAVSWDGRSTAGDLVSPGTYRWTLTAANADGSLLNADAGSGPISGSISTATRSIVSLACTSSTGVAYSPVTLTATVAGAGPGSVEFFDGSTSIGTSPAIDGSATLTTSTLGAASHSITATFTPTDHRSAATSAPVVLTLTNPSSHVGVTVVQPANDPGTLTMTTPYTPATPLELGELQLDPATNELATSVAFGSPTTAAIQVADTRPGNSNWTVSAQTSDFVNGVTHALINAQNTGITGLATATVPGGGLGATDISFDNVPPPAVPLAPGAAGTNGLGGKPHQLASTINGGNGTVGFYGVFTLVAPTSTAAGAYQGTIVFTIG